MRVTLNLSGEAIAKVRQLALQRGQSMGAVASELILQALEPREHPKVRNGVPLISSRARSRGKAPAPDVALVNRLRDAQS